MRVLITGAGGQLAQDLQRALIDREVVPLTHTQLDVTDGASVEEALRSHRPHVVINTAAFHRVDDCETREDLAFATNALAVRGLAEACAATDAILVHLSTDYVFGGQAEREPLGEHTRPAPTCVYGVSKLAGEELIRCTSHRYFVIRTCGLYGVAGAGGKGGNFVQTMLRKARAGEAIKVVNDQVCCPTYTWDLARKIVWLMSTDAFGLYHITNSGSCTWFDFARAIFQKTRVHASLEPTTTETFAAPAKRPPYSVLRHDGLASLGSAEMRPWQDALDAYLLEKGETAS